MKENGQDRLARAYAMLQAVRKNIAELTSTSVEETYVAEYHSALDMLESVGIDVVQFRIPPSQLRPIAVSIPVHYEGMPSRPPKYSKEKYVPKPFLLTKLDEILTYFEITMSKEPRKIGFSPPDKL